MKKRWNCEKEAIPQDLILSFYGLTCEGFSGENKSRQKLTANVPNYWTLQSSACHDFSNLVPIPWNICNFQWRTNIFERNKISFQPSGLVNSQSGDHLR